MSSCLCETVLAYSLCMKWDVCLLFAELFDNYMQQDAHEFLNYLLNTVADLLQGIYDIKLNSQASFSHLFTDLFHKELFLTRQNKLQFTLYAKTHPHHFHIILTVPKNTICQVTTTLVTSENVLFPGHNHLLTTSTDDSTLWLSSKSQWGW